MEIKLKKNLISNKNISKINKTKIFPSLYNKKKSSQ